MSWSPVFGRSTSGFIRAPDVTIRTVGIAAGVSGAALGLAVVALLPQRAADANREVWPQAHPVARGAYHVHSRRSDGTGTVDEIARAAAAARLQFVILTDHGDGTRPPEPPMYRGGVLCLDAVEISTAGGHYVALGLPGAPYRLAGQPDTVVEDVRRLGGFGIAAHPESAKPALRWSAWDVPIDGLEWLNADSEWRDELWGTLGRSLLTYPWRPAETLAAFLDRPTRELARWDALTSTRRIVGLAGADAHARLGYRQAADPYEDRVLARLPGYETSFRIFQNHVTLDRPFNGDAAHDAAVLLAAIREGHVHSTVNALAAPGLLDFFGRSGSSRALMGEYLDLDGDAVLESRVAAPENATMVLLKDGHAIYDTRESRFRVDVGTEAGAYRVEVRLAPRSKGPEIPWLVTNPIYVGLRHAHRLAAMPPQRAAMHDRAPVDTKGWRSEVSPGSTSDVEHGQAGDGRPAVDWRFALASSPAPPPYTALQFPLSTGLAGADRLVLMLLANRPMRLWAQLRAPASGDRWGRTFYVDESLTELSLFFDEFRPMGHARHAAPTADAIDSLLLVADTLNSRPGDRGVIHIRELWLAR
jgi:hypothetical protein